MSVKVIEQSGGGVTLGRAVEGVMQRKVGNTHLLNSVHDGQSRFVCSKRK